MPGWADKEPALIAGGDADSAPGWPNESFCYLTTIGRRTGRAHTIEDGSAGSRSASAFGSGAYSLWFAEDAGRVFLLADGGERADWVRNLRADPPVGLRVGSFAGPATASVVTDPADDALARRLLAAKYQGWEPGSPLSKWAETALAVVVVPEASQAGAETSPANP